MKTGNLISLIQRIFKPHKYSSIDPYFELEGVLDHAWIYREHEIYEQKEKGSFRTSRESRITLGEILSHTFNIKEEEISQLCINNEGHITQIEDQPRIWQWDLLSPYLPNEEKTILSDKHIFYTLLYRDATPNEKYFDKSKFNASGSIMIHTFSAGKYKDSTSYIDVTICAPMFTHTKQIQHKLRQDYIHYKNFSIAYDYKAPSQALAEYKFLKEEVESHPKEKPSRLSEKEWALLQNITEDIGNEFYWGKKAFNECRYLDAILYFENIYLSLCNRWYKKGLSSKEMNLLTETAFLIGFSYNDLKLYDKAYQYLELAARSNSKTQKYKKEFINCLVNSKNLLSIIYIDDYLQDIKNISTKERSEEDYNFFFFLLRRKAYILIEMDQYEDAEYILKRLLEEDPDNEIVLHELAFIQTQKKKQNIKEETEPKK